MAIVEIMGILNFDDDVQFWYTITVSMPVCEPFMEWNNLIASELLQHIMLYCVVLKLHNQAVGETGAP